jgi:hypothetical protein
MTSARGRAGDAAQLESFQTIIRMLEELSAGQRELVAGQDELRRLIRAKNPGGRPATHDWNALRLHLEARDHRAPFGTRAELRKVAFDFIEQNWPNPPDDRVIRDYLKPIADAWELV